MKILFGVFPAWGHVAPLVGVAQELQRRGHEVAFASHPSMGAPVGRAGLTLRDDFAWGDRGVRSQDHNRRHGPDLKWLIVIARGRPLGALVDDLARGVVDFRALLRRLRPDVLVSDLLFAPGPIGAEAEGVPYATSCPNALPHWDDAALPPYGTGLPFDAPRNFRWRALAAASRAVRRSLDRPLNRVRRRNGLAPLPHPFMSFSPYLAFSYISESIEYPHAHLGRQVHFVGPSLSRNRGDHGISFPWEWLDDARPLVLTSMGSIFTGARDLYRRVAEASRGEAWQMVVRVGPGMAQSLAGDLPDNVILLEEVPQLTLLRRAAAMISHGGVNSCLEALAAGVPLILTPLVLDQGDFSERVVRAGAGVRLHARRASPEDLRAALREAIFAAPLKERAGELAGELSRCDGALSAADLVERLGKTRRPVLRPEHSSPAVYRESGAA